MIDYHAHMTPEAQTLEVVARKFMPFPVPLPAGLLSMDFHIEQMDRTGIAERYISVPPIMYGYELPADTQVAHVRRLNDWLLEDVSHPRLHRTAVLPLSSADVAIAELRRMKESGIRSVAMGTHVHGMPLDELADEFWSALEECTDFVLIHPWQVRGAAVFGGYGLGNAIGNPVETTVAAARLVAAGVMARHPRLNIILSHGGGALPYLLGRIDQAWSHAKDDYPVMETAARQFLYDIIIFRPGQLRHLADVIGEDRIVMGTDSPFDMAVDDPAGLMEAAGLDLAAFRGPRIPTAA